VTLSVMAVVDWIGGLQDPPGGSPSGVSPFPYPPNCVEYVFDEVPLISIPRHSANFALIGFSEIPTYALAG